MSEPRSAERSGTGTGMILGVVVVLLIVVVFALFFFLFGGPGRFASGTPSQTNVNVPSQQQPASGPNINVPRQIDVNVNQPAQQAPAP